MRHVEVELASKLRTELGFDLELGTVLGFFKETALKEVLENADDSLSPAMHPVRTVSSSSGDFHYDCVTGDVLWVYPEFQFLEDYGALPTKVDLGEFRGYWGCEPRACEDILNFRVFFGELVEEPAHEWRAELRAANNGDLYSEVLI